MKKTFIFLVTVAAVLALSCLPLVAQVTKGSISGVVRDPSGANVPGAGITISNPDTGFTREMISDEQGTFVLSNLDPGNYVVKVSNPGFKTIEAKLVVEVGQTAQVNINMEIATVTGEILVVAEGQQQVNTTSAELNTNVARKQILDLPLPTRNPVDLVRLQAGVATISGTNARTAAINGLRGNLTNITQDGINVQDNYVRTDSLFALSAPSVENTGEISVAVGTVGSDSGSGAAQVRIVTPSGTNSLHGSVFEFLRNDFLNANSFFNNSSKTKRPTQRQNRFGFRLGGPFVIPKIYDGRNKSFFFGAYEGFREPIQTTRTRTVLTPEARQGIYRYTGSNGSVQTVNLLQIGNIKTLNPITKEMIDSTPLPNNSLVGDGYNTAGYRFNVSGSDPSNRWTLRADQQITEQALGGNHKIEFVINRSKFTIIPDTFNSIEAPFPGGIDAYQSSSRTQLAAAIHSMVKGYINEFRFGTQRAPVGFLIDKAPARGYIVNFAISQTPDNTFVSQGRNAPVYAFIDNLNWVKGRHALRGGFEIRSISAVDFNDVGTVKTVNLGTNSANPDGLLSSMLPNLPTGSTGNTIFTNAQTTYRTLVGLLGSVTQTFNVADPSSTTGFVPGTTRRRVEKYREYNFFLSDNWRLNEQFTLNLGLRYEYITDIDSVNKFALMPQTGVLGLYGISGFGNLFKPGTTPGTATNFLVPGGRSNGYPFYDPDKNNFAPFIGFAYSPNFDSGIGKFLLGGKGKGSIRGGFAISYTREGFTIITNVIGSNQGLSRTASNSTPTGILTSGGVPLTTPSFILPISDVDNYTSSGGGAGFWTVEPNMRNPYVQQWSLGIEREIYKGYTFEARYVGNHAVKLLRAYNLNEVNIFENGFLTEFQNAKKNLDINKNSFAPGAAGTVPLPIYSALFAGLPAGSGFSSSTFINQLNNGQVGTQAFTLANSPTYLNNRKSLTPNFFLANPNLNFARVTSNQGFSSYNALQLELRRRFSSGLFLQGNYTWAKSLGNSDSASSQSGLFQPQTLRDLSLDKTRTGFDITHTMNANFVYELPFGAGRKYLNLNQPVIKQILEGWQVQGLVSWRTSPWRSITSGYGTYNQATGTYPNPTVADAVSQINSKTKVYRTGTGIFWLDPSLLSLTTSASTGLVTAATLKPGLLEHPAAGTLGKISGGSFGSIRFMQTDFSVIKRTKMREYGDVEFRFELFNIFNNTNFSTGGQAITATSFGRITGAFDARIIQVALRVNF